MPDMLGMGARLLDGPLDEDDDYKPTAHLTVQIQSDFAWFDQDPANIQAVGDIPDGAFFRRARFGVFGEIYKTVEYRIEFDFAGEARPRFLDVWIALTDIPIIRNVIVGHFFEPFSLERYSPNRFITFNERSLADTFAPARNMGLMTYGNYFRPAARLGRRHLSHQQRRLRRPRLRRRRLGSHRPQLLPTLV